MKSRSTRETIWEALWDLHAQEQVATREVLADMTGLSMGMVDDHVKNLINDGRVRRLRAGVFQPVEAIPPARPVSCTVMPSGMVKIEVGDILLELSPREARMLSTPLAGFSTQYTQIQTAHELGRITTEVEPGLKRAYRTIAELANEVKALKDQMAGRTKQLALEI